MAEKGTISPFLHSMFRGVVPVWKADTQKQESDNSVVTRMSNLAPNMTVWTASDRLIIKQELQKYIAKEEKTLSRARAACSVVDKLSQVLSETHSLKHTLDCRFTTGAFRSSAFSGGITT